MMLKLFLAVLLCSVVQESWAEEEEVIVVQDWLTLRSRPQIVPPVNYAYTSKKGFIRNFITGRNIKPEHGPSCPRKDLWVKMANTDNLEGYKFRWIQAEGHLGYIQDVCGTVYIHTTGGSTNPPNDRYLVWHGDRHSGAMWGFDEEDKRVVHYGGKFMWGNRNSLNENSIIKVHEHRNDATRFYWVDEDGKESAYPDPTLTGKWELLWSVHNPSSIHTREVEHFIGKAMIRQVHQKVYWKMTASVAVGWFKADSRFEYYAEIAQTDTWIGWKRDTYKVTVLPGQSTAIWQYVFTASRFGEEYQYRSDMIEETDSRDKPPTS